MSIKSIATKSFLFALLSGHCFSMSNAGLDQIKLYKCYQEACQTSSDINKHVPVLCELASQCSSVIEIGVRRMVSTWGLLQGLSQNATLVRSYLGIDLSYPPSNQFNLAKQCAESSQIHFDFWKANDMDIDIPEADLLFIDSLHTYCHLTYELEKFHSKIGKYIALHDTSPPWEKRDDVDYHGDYSEYPAWINRTKRGLWPAVKDFLHRHPEWTLFQRRLNNHGFTILQRNEVKK